MKKFLFILLFSFFAFAAPFIRNPELSKTVSKAETLSANGEFVKAADAYFTALALENSEAQKELEEIKSFGCPYSLILHYERLNCLQKARRRRTETFKLECQKVLEKYKEQEEGKKWLAYIIVFEHLASHYRENNNKEMLRKTLKEGAERWPTSHFAGQYINHIVNTSPDPVPAATISEILKILQKHKNANNNKISSGMALCKLRLLKKNNGDVFDVALEHLKKYPNANFEETQIVITMARDAISFDKSEQIKQYYNVLLFLAIKQPSDKAHMKAIAFLVNERKKLETVVSEFKNSNPESVFGN